MKKVFISYSHRDEKWKNSLITHLQALEMEGILLTRHDRDIAPGSDWEKEIDQALQEVEAAVLLISPDFLVSAFIKTKELPVLLRRREKGEIELFPLLVHACNWQHSEELAKLQVVPADGRPLASFPKAKRETILAEFAAEISRTLPSPAVPRPPKTGKTQPADEGGSVPPGDTKPRADAPKKRKISGGELATRITIIVGVLTILGWVFDLPKNVKECYREIFGTVQPATCPLKGMVMDPDGNPVGKAEVRVDVLPGTVVKTTDDGNFTFPGVPGEPGDRVRVTVTAPNGMRGDLYVTLGKPVHIEVK